MMSGHNAICVATALLETGMVIKSCAAVYAAYYGAFLIFSSILKIKYPLAQVHMEPGEGAVTSFALEAPAGKISIEARGDGQGRVLDVSLRNAPAFVPPGGLGLRTEVPGGVGPVDLDVAYGGMW